MQRRAPTPTPEPTSTATPHTHPYSHSLHPPMNPPLEPLLTPTWIKGICGLNSSIVSFTAAATSDTPGISEWSDWNQSINLSINQSSNGIYTAATSDTPGISDWKRLQSIIQSNDGIYSAATSDTGISEWERLESSNQSINQSIKQWYLHCCNFWHAGNIWMKTIKINQSINQSSTLLHTKRLQLFYTQQHNICTLTPDTPHAIHAHGPAKNLTDLCIVL